MQESWAVDNEGLDSDIHDEMRWKTRAFVTMEGMRSGYYCRDACQLEKLVPRSSIDATITSPPYGSLKNYGVQSQIGFGQSYNEYLRTLGDVFKQCLRVTRDSGSLWILADTFKEKGQLRLFPFDLAGQVAAAGWTLRDVMIWNKTKTLPWSRKGQLRNVFEYILFFTKGNSFKYHVQQIKEPEELKEWWVKYPERYSPLGKVPTNIWTFPIPVQGSWAPAKFRHFCPFPPALVERILLLTTDPSDVVLDPFAGSGIVLAQAKCMGRKYIGLDVNKSFVQQFHQAVTKMVKHNWDAKRQILNHREDARRELADQIIKLRELKFPKILYKEMVKKNGPNRNPLPVSEIVTIAIPLNGKAGRYKYAQSLVYVLTDTNENVERLRNLSAGLTSHPPLSKYGIAAEIKICLREAFLNGHDGLLLRSQQLFVYLEGATNLAKKRVALEDWLRDDSIKWKRTPPVLSNVHVQQPVVHTWRAPAKN